MLSYKVCPEKLFSADDYFKKFTPQQIAEIEYAQGVATWPGISFMINNDWTWRDGLIIEGVNILPQLVATEQARRDGIQALFLTDDNWSRAKEVIFKRSLYSKADSYPDKLKEQELKWLKIFDSIIRKEAELHDQPIFTMTKTNTDLPNITKIFEEAS